jgi:hypothetical protein
LKYAIAATAPKSTANGLDARLEAAPVDSGTPPAVVTVGLEAPEVVRERVADVMVLLRPVAELTAAEAVVLADDVTVTEEDSDEEAALLVDAAVDEATEEEIAEETASEPVRPMGPM